MNIPAAEPRARMTLAEFHRLLADQHPFAQVLGIDVVDIGHGTARAVLPARDTHQRLGGIVAGPMLMGLADLTMYAAVVGATGQAGAVTANLTIHFLRKTSGAAVIADARVLKTGRLAMAEAILRCDGADEPVAHVVSAWAVPAP
ncbi:thioesterase [Bordetella pertussis]|uniref:Thioesterase domain-containing protein n=6 Tax=Bordetella TaxID=517 RepID=Q7VZQ6_BORPE|nr:MULTISPECIES: PaaI family thioesterase [Bordetella]ETH40688.1 hypothetical protein L547_3247 [Bordetella pertussis H918]ETH43016.1 hypothetical protein L549_3297 [Bordetella pertussis H939]ETH48647.1 hypothetical protein L548_0430 [Bordetella pertussis H921]ETH71777.1 hypothetical protein L545_0634 [Bordetella pertussis STO1-CHLA-0011]ETH82615.1 hypothetical protein L559_0264 [Bordetella pertussis STO1-CHOC-0017]ETH85699.1 hypothetical protein L560_3127 [Bordetella pertussis STO1-CHOC-0018